MTFPVIVPAIQGAAIALVASAIAAPLVYKSLVRIGSRQTISQHIGEHAHKQGTPTMGGLIIVIGVLVALLAAGSREMLAPIVLVLGFGLVGFIDDFVVPRMMKGKRGLGWMPKLLLEIGSGVLAVWLVTKDPVQIAVGLFWVLFFSNAYNFSDGLDTLAGGLAVMLSVGFLAIGGGALTSPMSAAMGAVIGGAIPFLVLNAPPAKVFMGDVGSLPIGALFGWVFGHMFVQVVPGALAPDGASQATAAQLAGLTVMGLVMAAELLPVPVQIGWVKAFKRRAFQFKTPIHHEFQSRGWPETRIVWLFHMVQAGLVIVGAWIAWGPK